MKHIFYFMTVFAIMYEAQIILHPIKSHTFLKGLKGKKSSDYNTKEQLLAWLMFGYVVWTFVGLVSFQWPLFLLLILMGFIPKFHPMFRFVDSIISFATLIFIVINEYHLNIDVWSFVKSLIN